MYVLYKDDFMKKCYRMNHIQIFECKDMKQARIVFNNATFWANPFDIHILEKKPKMIEGVTVFNTEKTRPIWYVKDYFKNTMRRGDLI